VIRSSYSRGNNRRKRHAKRLIIVTTNSTMRKLERLWPNYVTNILIALKTRRGRKSSKELSDNTVKYLIIQI
jgi:hypothetical protein